VKDRGNQRGWKTLRAGRCDHFQQGEIEGREKTYLGGARKSSMIGEKWHCVTSDGRWGGGRRGGVEPTEERVGHRQSLGSFRGNMQGADISIKRVGVGFRQR